MVLCLTVRRFFCDHVDCSACTFEQVPGLTERHARRSIGLQGALAAIGLALAGRAGSRLAASLGMAVSRSTLLRLIRGLPDPPVGQVTVLGVASGLGPANDPNATGTATHCETYDVFAFNLHIAAAN